MKDTTKMGGEVVLWEECSIHEHPTHSGANISWCKITGGSVLVCVGDPRLCAPRPPDWSSRLTPGCRISFAARLPSESAVRIRVGGAAAEFDPSESDGGVNHPTAVGAAVGAFGGWGPRPGRCPPPPAVKKSAPAPVSGVAPLSSYKHSKSQTSLLPDFHPVSPTIKLYWLCTPKITDPLPPLPCDRYKIRLPPSSQWKVTPRIAENW